MNARTRHLLETQASRFIALDPLLPSAPPVPEGDVLTAALDDGGRVAGIVRHLRHDQYTLSSLWSASDVYELTPLLGDSAPRGMDALLRALRRWLDRNGPSGADSSCVVLWPSRDIEASRALLDHGLMALTVLAVHTGPPAEPTATSVAATSVSVRRARPADLPVAVELAMAELRYSARTGASNERHNAEQLKRGLLGRRLAQGEPVFLAEHDGVPVAMADCTISDLEPGTLLPAGRWGYVNTVSVTPDMRGTGIGRQLMAYTHDALDRMGARGTYLYYNPANPLSSVFWNRQGYRPVWTIWEVRPASALR